MIDQNELRSRLIDDFDFKEQGNKFTQGKCPNCGKKSVWEHQNDPKLLRCNHINNCGYSETIRERYPDLFEEFTKKHPPTETDPKATARAYLHSNRHFNTATIEDWYEQGQQIDYATNKATATVKFWLDKDNGIYWERLIDYADHFGKKAHFQGKYGGKWWVPPNQNIDAKKPVYITEGIFDAIALHFAGHQVASILSCSNYPHEALKALDVKPSLVWALDNNTAGIDAAKQFAERAQEDGFDSFVAIPNKGAKDWNDLHIHRRADLPDIMEQALWHGLFLRQTNAGNAAAVLAMQTRKPYRIITINHAYWEAKYNEKELDKKHGDKEDPTILEGYFDRTLFGLLRDDEFLRDIKSCIDLKCLSNCQLNFLYQQVNQYTNERHYHFDILYQNGDKPTQIDLSGANIAGANELNKALLGNSKAATFIGSKPHLEYLQQNLWFKTQIKVVSTIDFIGYDPKTKVYVFDDCAFISGFQVKENKQGYMARGEVAIKSTMQLTDPIRLSDKFDTTGFMHHLQGAFGARGLLVLAWWSGSLFATQIRERVGHYPFFEFVGQASSGKSTLIESLWKLFGRTHEGFNPAISNWAYVTREMSQVSNLPVVMIEADAKDFNWEQLKAAHEGKGTRGRGVATSGNETNNPPFRGALMCSQNEDIKASEAMLSRFVYLNWSRHHHTEGGEMHADSLRAFEPEQLAGFLPMLLKQEKLILDRFFELLPVNVKTLNKTAKINRIVKNHAIVATMLQVLSDILPMSDLLLNEAFGLIPQIAMQRQVACETDHPVVADFWDLYEDYNVYAREDVQGDLSSRERFNHSKDNNMIAVNLSEFEKFCRDQHISPPDRKELKRHLKQSQRYKFEAVKSVNSQLVNGTKHCYVFKKPTKEEANYGT